MYLRHMPKLLTLLVILSLLACGDRNEAETTATDVPDSIEVGELPAITRPNRGADEILKQWPEYNALDNALQSLSTISSRSEVNIVLDNVKEKLELLEASEFPEAFDTPRVKSRLKVMRTYLLKTKATMVYGDDPVPPVKDLWEAYGNLIRQFNVIVNNNLDTKLILDE